MLPVLTCHIIFAYAMVKWDTAFLQCLASKQLKGFFNKSSQLSCHVGISLSLYVSVAGPILQMCKLWHQKVMILDRGHSQEFQSTTLTTRRAPSNMQNGPFCGKGNNTKELLYSTAEVSATALGNYPFYWLWIDGNWADSQCRGCFSRLQKGSM